MSPHSETSPETNPEINPRTPPPPGGAYAGVPQTASESLAPEFRRWPQRPPSSPDVSDGLSAPPPAKGQESPTQKLRPRTVALGIGLALVAILILQFFIILAIGTDPSDYDRILAGLISTIPIDLLILIGVPYLLLGGNRQVWPALGLRRPTWRTLAWASAGLLLAYAVLGVYSGLVDLVGIDALEPVSAIDDQVIYDNVALVVLVAIVAIAIAPISEEIFYRSFIFGGLGRSWGFVLAGLASGLLFAATHFDVGSIIPFTAIGFAFAWVYYRSRNIFASVGAHLLFNAIAVAFTLADRGVG